PEATDHEILRERLRGAEPVLRAGGERPLTREELAPGRLLGERHGVVITTRREDGERYRERQELAHQPLVSAPREFVLSRARDPAGRPGARRSARPRSRGGP